MSDSTGGRIHNGLIVGPPECGKTNTLRIIAIEAAASGLFVPVLLRAGARTDLSVSQPRPRLTEHMRTVYAVLNARGLWTLEDRVCTDPSPDHVRLAQALFGAILERSASVFRPG